MSNYTRFWGSNLEQRACVVGVKETKHGIEVTFYNKEKALEMLGRHLGMFKDNVKK